jgi:hypothetical protein
MLRGALTWRSSQIQNAISIPPRLLHTLHGGSIEPVQQSYGESFTREKHEACGVKNLEECITKARQLIESKNQNASAGEQYKAMYDSYNALSDDERHSFFDLAYWLGVGGFSKKQFKGSEQNGPLAEFKTVMKVIERLLDRRIREHLEFDGNRGSGKRPDFLVKLANAMIDIIFLAGEAKATDTNTYAVPRLHQEGEKALEAFLKEDLCRFPDGLVVPIVTLVGPELRFGSIEKCNVVFPESIPPFCICDDPGMLAYAICHTVMLIEDNFKNLEHIFLCTDLIEDASHGYVD